MFCGKGDMIFTIRSVAKQKQCFGTIEKRNLEYQNGEFYFLSMQPAFPI